MRNSRPLFAYRACLAYRRSSRRRQRGQAIVLLALMMVGLIAMTAISIDIGLAMSQRRELQTYADDAALAGSRSYKNGSDAAHYVALQYLGAQLGFSLPVGACASASNCPATTYVTGPYTLTLTDQGGQPPLDVSVVQSQPTAFGRALGVLATNASTAARAIPVGPAFVSAVYALAAVAGDAIVHGGGTSSPTGNVGGPVYAHGSFGANNEPHAPTLPTVQHNYDGTQCSGSPANRLDLGGGGNGLNFNWGGGSGLLPNTGVAPPTSLDKAGPTISGPVYTSTVAAQDAQGHWKPGLYNGVFPSGGVMNAGVYKIVNVTSTIALGSITNVNHQPSGQADPNGVAIVLDSSDTGSLDVSSAVLNGLDDLHPQGYTGPRDPAGTHNFVVFGGNGATGYSQGVTIGPQATTDLSGIFYLPKSTLTYDGNSSPKFTGSVTVASATVNGGGNGIQVFSWVCGLASVAGKSTQGGLTR